MKKNWPASRPGWRRLHKKDLPEVRAEYERGASCEKIGAARGITDSAVKKYLRRNNVQLRPHGGDRRSAQFKGR